MNTIKFSLPPKKLTQIAQFVLLILVLSILSGCLEDYGRLKRDTEIQNAFETNQVPADYDYYFYGLRSWPYAVIGIDPSYNLNSRMWRAVEPDSVDFKHMTYWIWEDYGYHPYGAYILNPEGQKIGIWYASVWFAAVKVANGTKTIEVMPHIFLGGP